MWEKARAHPPEPVTGGRRPTSSVAPKKVAVAMTVVCPMDTWNLDRDVHLPLKYFTLRTNATAPSTVITARVVHMEGRAGGQGTRGTEKERGGKNHGPCTLRSAQCVHKNWGYHTN